MDLFRDFANVCTKGRLIGDKYWLVGEIRTVNTEGNLWKVQLAMYLNGSVFYTSLL